MSGTEQTLPEPGELKPVSSLILRVIAELDRILLGRHELHRMVVAGILSRGHILLEGLPGLGKTALVKTLGQIFKLQFSRVQFTPDLMPSDILGANILQDDGKGSRSMVFHPGPVFTNLLLADEINRASPKTQSALLEAMQESSVTLLGETHPMPFPFFVLASQNPIEMEGTYPLPEAQLDRFMVKLNVPSLGSDDLRGVITGRRRGETPAAELTVSADELKHIFSVMDRIFLPRPVADYIARLVAATHPGGPLTPASCSEKIAYGASPRAAIALAELSRALALTAGRPAVSFDEVKVAAPAVLNHRLILNYRARMDNVTPFHIIETLLREIDPANLNPASSVELT
jgi:MoxR-like ATPase